MCDHIETLGGETNTLLHVPLLAGVCVTYMQPFGRNNGLGPLPRSFAEFTGAEKGHAKVHADLKRLRNWFYAHRDLLNLPRLFAKAGSDFGDVTFHLDRDRTYSFSVHQLSWEMVGVQRVRELCRVQRRRTDKQADELLHQLHGATPLTPGDYVLGKDLP